MFGNGSPTSNPIGQFIFSSSKTSAEPEKATGVDFTKNKLERSFKDPFPGLFKQTYPNDDEGGKKKGAISGAAVEQGSKIDFTKNIEMSLNNPFANLVKTAHSDDDDDDEDDVGEEEEGSDMSSDKPVEDRSSPGGIKKMKVHPKDLVPGSAEELPKDEVLDGKNDNEAEDGDDETGDDEGSDNEDDGDDEDDGEDEDDSDDKSDSIKEGNGKDELGDDDEVVNVEGDNAENGHPEDDAEDNSDWEHEYENEYRDDAPPKRNFPNFAEVIAAEKRKNRAKIEAEPAIVDIVQERTHRNSLNPAALESTLPFTAPPVLAKPSDDLSLLRETVSTHVTNAESDNHVTVAPPAAVVTKLPHQQTYGPSSMMSSKWASRAVVTGQDLTIPTASLPSLHASTGQSELPPSTASTTSSRPASLSAYPDVTKTVAKPDASISSSKSAHTSSVTASGILSSRWAPPSTKTRP